MACQVHPALVKWSHVTWFYVNVSRLVHLSVSKRTKDFRDRVLSAPLRRVLLETPPPWHATMYTSRRNHTPRGPHWAWVGQDLCHVPWHPSGTKMAISPWSLVGLSHMSQVQLYELGPAIILSNHPCIAGPKGGIIFYGEGGVVYPWSAVVNFFWPPPLAHTKKFCPPPFGVKDLKLPLL